MKRMVLIFAVLLSVLSIDAQPYPTQVKVSQPAALSKNLITEKEIEKFLSDGTWGQNKTNSNYWIVYSDRDNNPAYKAPQKGSAVSATLALGQKLRIAEIKNGFALVYEENYNAYPKISSYAKFYGWMPMEKLLLWHTCPTNDYGIYQKALIVANLTEFKNSSKDGFLRLYPNPENGNSKGIPTSMEFNFVMKKLDNGMVLLATECNVEQNSTSVIRGWVKKNTYVEWNQRTCIEPNWLPKDVEYLISRKVYAEIANNKDFTGATVKYYFNQPNGSKREYDKYRMSRNVVRFPILDWEDTTVYRCNVISSPNGSINDAVRLKDEAYRMNSELLENVSNMNLILCIDATTSMEPYFTSVYNAITEAMKRIPEGQKMKVGIVLYRDYADGDDGVVEYLPMLRPDDIRIKNFLSTGGQKGVVSARGDRTMTEALYRGIEAALDTVKMGYSAKHSNFLLVVGDCGNDPSDNRCMTQGQILDKLIANNVQLLSFQVMRKNEGAWKLFNGQMSDLIDKNVKERYKRINEKLSADKKITVSWKESSNAYVMARDEKNTENLFIGSLLYGKLGVQMPGAELTNLIVSNVNSFVDFIDYRKKYINDMPFLDPDIINVSENAGIVSAEQALVMEMAGSEYAEILKRTRSITSFEGFTRKKERNSGTEQWKPILFISKEELANLIEKLRPLYDAARKNQTDDRRPYVQAIKTLIRSMVPGISDAEMNKKSVQEVMLMIQGLNETTRMTGKEYTLLQIQDSRSVSTQEYLALLKHFKTRYEKLKSVPTMGYKYFFESNGQKYYWLPLDYLP